MGLHDIGKLGVPNLILDKPGPLTAAERVTLAAHPQHSYEILGRIKAFREIATLAGEHHERLDGTGYPNGRTASQLTAESRIIAVADMYSALSESRPYRPDLSRHQVQELMRREVPTRLDAECFELLVEATGGPLTAEAIVPAGADIGEEGHTSPPALLSLALTPEASPL